MLSTFIRGEHRGTCVRSLGNASRNHFFQKLELLFFSVHSLRLNRLCDKQPHGRTFNSISRLFSSRTKGPVKVKPLLLNPSSRWATHRV